MVLTVEKEKPGMLSLVNKAIKALYRDPQSVFMTAPVRDLLFDGVVINCTLTDFAGKAICTQLKANAKDMERVSEDIFKFSFFGMQNGSLSSQFRVKRGIKNITDIGRVVEFNGQKKLSSWSGEKCNEISGTDGTIFPPFLTSEDKILAFSPELCRTIAAVFERPTTYKGIKGYRYTATLGDMSSNPDEKCFCPTEDTCLKKGSFELSRCAGAPLVVTLPHMYETDEEYLRSVIGQHPEQRKHEIFMEFEPMTGTPLGARRRLQFNIFLHKVDKIDLMKEVPSALLPIFWINEGLELGDKFVNDLNNNLFRTLNILSGVQWTMMGGGLALAAGAVLLHYKKRSGFATVSNPLALAAKSNGIPSVEGSLRY
uniref:Sensory neuron membrane protein 1 n=1 Tax=Timema douglasi TaxID=61478 RepID=A0A7R8VHL2_TIMDO|nr:unnamed protein product [Timema douglasi]